MPKVSLRDIALAAGVSEMTVSRALRAQAEVSDETRERILQIARELDYRIDPQIVKMMAYMRSSKATTTKENLAFLWLDALQTDVAGNAFLEIMFAGVKARARTLGFGIDQFFLRESGIDMARISQILYARGINGVILSPLIRHVEFEVSLNWEQFSTVIIGGGHVGPALHRVAPDHYQGMACAMRELANLGYTRIGLCVRGESLLRQDHRWEGSFLLHHPLGIRDAAELILVGADCTDENIVRWAKQTKPEVVLFQGQSFPEISTRRRLPSAITKLRWATLDWLPSMRLQGVAGIDQRRELTAADAVDLVTAHVLRNERGLPAAPKLVLCEGIWEPGESVVPKLL